MTPVLLALALSGNADAAARLHIESDKPVTVSVNRHPYTPKAQNYDILCDPGRNRLQVGDRVLIVDVPNGHEARLSYRGGQLTLVETVFVEGLAETDYIDDYYDPNEDPANRNGLQVVETPTVDANQGPGTLHLYAEGGAWYNIAVNGVTSAQLRNFFEAETTLSLAPGPQKLEVRDASGTRILSAGTLRVPSGESIDVRVTAQGLVIDAGTDLWTPQ